MRSRKVSTRPRKGIPTRSPHRRASTTITAAKRPRGGRPSVEESGRIADRIVLAASALFLAEGYGATSIEDVVRKARVSKRTFYVRFKDKEALFGAVLHRIIEDLRPARAMPPFEGKDLAENLRLLARLILQASLTPQAVALHRLLVGESARFPALAAALHRNAAGEEGVALIAGLLEREAHRGKIAPRDSEFAARQFMQMVIGIPLRRAVGMGPPMSRAELKRWPEKVVVQFLEGCRPR